MTSDGATPASERVAIWDSMTAGQQDQLLQRWATQTQHLGAVLSIVQVGDSIVVAYTVNMCAADVSV